MEGKSTRIGAYKCYACRKKFTVKIGTIFEDSHIPMRLWLKRSSCWHPVRRASAQTSSTAHSASPYERLVHVAQAP